MFATRMGWLWTSVFLIGTLLIGPALTGAQEEIISLNTAEVESRERPPVAFPHELHMGLYECLDCHHAFEDGTNILDEDELYEGNEDVKCAACHGPGDNPDLQQAFHYQCMRCHIEVRKSGETSGPELCGSCHIPQ